MDNEDITYPDEDITYPDNERAVEAPEPPDAFEAREFVVKGQPDGSESILEIDLSHDRFRDYYGTQGFRRIQLRLTPIQRRDLIEALEHNPTS